MDLGVDSLHVFSIVLDGSAEAMTSLRKRRIKWIQEYGQALARKWLKRSMLLANTDPQCLEIAEQEDKAFRILCRFGNGYEVPKP